MSRFREEVYESKAHKAWVKAAKRETLAGELFSRPEAKGSQALRVEYYAQPRKGYRKRTAPAAQERLI